ncbi:MAG: hypothetical protein AB8B60_18685 [Sulfitobacter sp.]
MKRRTFVSMLTALVATPALPVSATIAAPAGKLTQHFAKAKLLARCHDRASPEMFERLMKLDSQTAQGLFDMLKDRSVIAKGADGVTRAMNPLNTHCVPNEAIRARDYAKLSSEMGQRLRNMAKKHLQTADEDRSQGNNTSPDTADAHDADPKPSEEI